MADKACLSGAERELGAGDEHFPGGEEPAAGPPGSDLFLPISGPYFG